MVVATAKPADFERPGVIRVMHLGFAAAHLARLGVKFPAALIDAGVGPNALLVLLGLGVGGRFSPLAHILGGALIAAPGTLTLGSQAAFAAKSLAGQALGAIDGVGYSAVLA